MARTSRKPVVAILVAGVVLAAGAGAAAYAAGSPDDGTPVGVGTSEASAAPVVQTPSPTPTTMPAPMPADCAEWFDGFTSPVLTEEYIDVASVTDGPVRTLQSPADAALVDATDRVWCDVVSVSDGEDLTSSFAASRLAPADATDLRASLAEAGAACAPVSGGVLCVDVVAYDPDDPTTIGASDVHYFRSGIWIAASIQQESFATPQQVFRDAAVLLFPGLP